MRFFEYNYKTFDGEEKTLKLRLVSSDMKTIESKNKISLLDYVSHVSITMITNMLMYLRRPEVPNFSATDSEKLYDELIDAGLTMEEVYINIIMEALVISGFMKKEDLEQLKGKAENEKREQLEEPITPRK
jgi:hypothetical protein